MTNPPRNYAAFLRGINVGGRRRVPMADLRTALGAAGFAGVGTYIQSGNIRFSAPPQDVESLQERIASCIAARFGLDDVPVCVRTVEELGKLVAASPFGPREDPKRTYVAFLAAAPRQRPRLPLRDDRGECEIVSRRGRDLFCRPLTVEKGKGNPHELVERSFGVPATLRNMNTVVEMARAR